VVAQEIDRDYAASVKGVVIPGAWVRSAIDAKAKLGIAPAGSKGLAFDVADEGDDKDAVCLAEGTEVLMTDEWSGKGGDIFESTEYVFDLCDEHGLTEFRYDSDGIGAGVRGDARVLNERRKASKQRQINAIGYRGSEAVYEPEGIVEGTIGLRGRQGPHQRGLLRRTARRRHGGACASDSSGRTDGSRTAWRATRTRSSRSRRRTRT
jgi:hypothetical protein